MLIGTQMVLSCSRRRVAEQPQSHAVQRELQLSRELGSSFQQRNGSAEQLYFSCPNCVPRLIGTRGEVGRPLSLWGKPGISALVL